MGTTTITQLAPRIYSPEQRGVPTAEAPLHEAALASARFLAPPKMRKLLVVPELEIGGVRPDLWIGSFNQKSFKRRLAASLEPCTAPYPLAVVDALRRLGGEAEVNQLRSPAFRLGDRRRIQRGISELVERQLAFRSEGCIRLNPAFKPGDVRGVGVEAKLGRWRKAVRQVQMWRNFVNGAWLLFPSTYLPHVPRQHPGLRSLGLAIADEEGVVTVVRRPRLTVGRPMARALAEEHVYARWSSEALPGPIVAGESKRVRQSTPKAALASA
jgi:hypothetical protein